jgi:hypothetical protein
VRNEQGGIANQRIEAPTRRGRARERAALGLEQRERLAAKQRRMSRVRVVAEHARKAR